MLLLTGVFVSSDYESITPSAPQEDEFVITPTYEETHIYCHRCGMLIIENFENEPAKESLYKNRPFIITRPWQKGWKFTFHP